MHIEQHIFKFSTCKLENFNKELDSQPDHVRLSAVVVC